MKGPSLTPRMIPRYLSRISLFAVVVLVGGGAHCPPPGPCFVDIGPRPTVRVVLGEQVRDDGRGQSCAGLDGIDSRAVFILHLTKNYDQVCYSSDYRAEQIDGVRDVAVETAEGSYGVGFAATAGDFSSAQSKGCRGSWRLKLGPSNEAAVGISPLDDTTGWLVTREMDIAQAQFCDGELQSAGNLYCRDTFAVASMTEVLP